MDAHVDRVGASRELAGDLDGALAIDEQRHEHFAIGWREIGRA
jgi:hypothetical protein